MNPNAASATRCTRTPTLIVATSVAILAAVGCSSSSAPRTGSLDVTVVAPTGVTGNITVTGPAGYSKPVGATTTLTGLAPGSYTVTAAAVTSADPIVGVLETAAVSGSPVAVTSGKATAAATVTYSARPGSGGLWVSNFGSVHTTVQYTAAQLASTTSAVAATSITTGTIEELGAAFDANGNLWVTIYGGTSIVEFSALQLATSGTPAPAVTISGNAGSLIYPSGLAFDAGGNLWVANIDDSSIVEFTPSQLASSGSPAPAVTITSASGSLDGPIGLAFDASGDLWVADIGARGLVEFTPSQLAASGSPTPAVTIIPPSGTLDGALMLAFDASGRLWVTNGNNSPYSVIAFSASQLTASGTPTPVITLTANAASLDHPAGLAFDASGNLWIANVGNASVAEFTAAQIAASGDPVPTTVITGSSLNEPFGIAFDPHAAGLPIKP
jgi:sugar lactone lactonase YvrE